MGAGIRNRLFRRIDRLAQAWRGWGEADMISLSRKLDDPAAYGGGGIVKITNREYRAWAELNRGILESKLPVLRSPLLAWVEGHGLYPMIRVTVAERPAADAVR
jgi:hypothetical protein